jgi:hypothetical protein
MKQHKTKDTQARQGGYPADANAGDSRPLKPPAGQQAYHRFPLAEVTVAALVKPTTASSRPADSGGGGGRQVKAATEPPADEAGEALAARGHHPDGKHPAQRPRSGTGSERPTEQYVRLRVRVRGDQLTVLDSHLVDGPLSAPTTLHGAAVYEVTAGDRLVHTSAVPDLGQEQRSFPNLEGPPGQRGHHFHRARLRRILGTDPGRGTHCGNDRSSTGSAAPPHRTGLGRACGGAAAARPAA